MSLQDKSCRVTASPAMGPRPPNRERQVERADGGNALRFRGNENNTNCSPRYLNANNAASNTNRNNGCSAHILS